MTPKYVLYGNDYSVCYYEGDRPEPTCEFFATKKEAELKRKSYRDFWHFEIVEIPKSVKK